MYRIRNLVGRDSNAYQVVNTIRGQLFLRKGKGKSNEASEAKADADRVRGVSDSLPSRRQGQELA